MKDFCLSLCLFFFLMVLQSCTTLDEKSGENYRTVNPEGEGDLLHELHELKVLLDDRNEQGEVLDDDNLSQPVEFGMSLKRVQDMYPAPDKFEYKPLINEKVTMLTRDVKAGRFNFFFYEDKAYKVIFMKKWGSLSLQFAEKEINNFKTVFLDNYGKPDGRQAGDGYEKMLWVGKELDVTIEVFSLMSHSGLERVLTLIYSDRNTAPLAKRSESFDLYRGRRKGILDQ